MESGLGAEAERRHRRQETAHVCHQMELRGAGCGHQNGARIPDGNQNSAQIKRGNENSARIPDGNQNGAQIKYAAMKTVRGYNAVSRTAWDTARNLTLFTGTPSIPALGV